MALTAMIRQWFYTVYSTARRNNTASIVHHLDTNDPMRYIIGHSIIGKAMELAMVKALNGMMAPDRVAA